MLELFFQMQQEQIQADAQTFTNLFMACGKLKDKLLARQVYAAWLEADLSFSEFSAASAISMFAKCNALDLAQHVSKYLNILLEAPYFCFDFINTFETIKDADKTESIFNSMISAYLN